MPYSAGVVAKGLQTVRDLYTSGSTGPRTALTNTLSVGNVPSGCTRSGSAPWTLTLGAGGGTISNWDLRGHHIYIENSATWVFNDCDVGDYPTSAGGYLYQQGENGSGSTPSVTWNYCRFNGDIPRTGSNGIVINNGDYLFDHCLFRRFSVQVFVAIGAADIGAGTIQYSVFTRPGINSFAGTAPTFLDMDHIESVAWKRGTHVFYRNLIDASLDAETVDGGLTAPLFAEGYTGPDLDLTVEECVLINWADINGGVGGYNFQGKPAAPAAMMTVSFINNDMEGGLNYGSFINPSVRPYLVLTSGNVEDLDASDIDGQLGAGSYGQGGTGSATLTLTASGVGKVGAGGIGASTLNMAAAASGAVYGPIVGTGASTLALTASAAGGSAFGTGSATLALVASGSGSQSDSSSGVGQGSLEMGAAASGAVGVSGTGDTTLILLSDALATASGLAARVLGSSGKTAPPRGPKTRTAQPVG